MDRTELMFTLLCYGAIGGTAFVLIDAAVQRWGRRLRDRILKAPPRSAMRDWRDAAINPRDRRAQLRWGPPR